MKRHLVFPSEFFDNTPSFFGALVILDVDDLISCIGLESSNRLGISKHKIGRAKAKTFLHDVSEIRSDGVGGWKDENTDSGDGACFFKQFLSTPADLVEVFNEETFDERPVLLKGVEHRFEFFRFEGRAGQLSHLPERDDGEFFNQFSDVFLP